MKSCHPQPHYGKIQLFRPCYRRAPEAQGARLRAWPRACGLSVSCLPPFWAAASLRLITYTPLPPFPPHFCFPPPTKASQTSLFRARILLKAQKGDGFYRPRTRTGRMLMSLPTSLPRSSCHLQWGEGPRPTKVRSPGAGLATLRVDCSGGWTLTYPVTPHTPSMGPKIWYCHLLPLPFQEWPMV